MYINKFKPLLCFLTSICIMLTAVQSFAQEKMPDNAYKGKDRVSLETKIADAYKKRYSTDNVKKVVITDSSWQPRQEIIGLKKITNYYISAHVAVDRGEKCTVYRLTFKRVGKNAELHSIGESYKINTADLPK